MLEIKNYSKTYGEGRKAADNVSLTVEGGDIYAVCPETPVIEHRCMLHPKLSGEVIWTAENGQYAINNVLRW